MNSKKAIQAHIENLERLENDDLPEDDSNKKEFRKKQKVNYLYSHTGAKVIKKVKKYVDGQMINIELFEDDEKDNKRMDEKQLVRVFD